MSNENNSIIHEDENKILRMENSPNGVTIKVHAKKNGEERIPNGYMVGYNYFFISHRF